ncbi:site-specific integrase [Ammonifex thiophilus]|uniref:Site-specific integrase n=1 Tax=Ammonifex thiophilus TaxID=444093 RepID=A0A3D8P128_9THEO|nr:site-specific integrase [Ammonifex thiophilus]RDV80920.1 site-specific integrase [Ammonifex thiophilus]
MAKKPSLFHLFRLRAESLLRVGEKKHRIKKEAAEEACRWWLESGEKVELIRRATLCGGIFSFRTFKACLQVAGVFCGYLKEHRSDKGKEAREKRDIEVVKPYVAEFLVYRRDVIGCSPWTLKKERSLLRKLYLNPELASEVELPPRSLQNRRPLKEAEVPERYRALVDFARATGLRRMELRQVRVEDVQEKDGCLQVHVRRGKGGKWRWVRVRRDVEERVREIVAEAKEQRKEKLFPRIPGWLGVKVYRREYTRVRLEEEMERLKAESPELKARELKKRAKLEVSRDLGHNRTDVMSCYLC